MEEIRYERIRRLEIKEVAEEVQNLYLDFMKVNNSPDVCSITKVMANWPVLLKSKWESTKVLMYGQGKLPIRIKNALALIVAAGKNCEERIQFYAHVLRKEGLSDEEIRNIIRIDQKHLPEMEVSMLSYALKSSTEPLRVTDLDFFAVKEFGVSNWQLVEMQEVITKTAYNVNYSNTLNLPGELWYKGFELEESHPPMAGDYRKNANYKKYVDKYYRMATTYADRNKNILKLNPHAEKVKELIDGLARNYIEFGRAYCPCMVPRISKDETENRKRICPCAFHKEDIERDGQCECGLFIRGV